MNSTVEKMQGICTQLIYSEAKIEGVNATYVDIENIVENGSDSVLSSLDTNVIIGLKQAWEYLSAHYTYDISFDLASIYNEMIGYGGTFASPGMLRGSRSVRVGDWYPDDVDENTFNDVCEYVFNLYSSLAEQACALVLELSKKQMFHNGNKRTAQMIGNHFLAFEDAGCIFLLDDQAKRNYFLDSLYDYYTGNFSLESFVDLLLTMGIQRF